jgi:hypothetical protein
MWRRVGLSAAICFLLLGLALGASLLCVAARAERAESPPRIPAQTTPGLIVQGHVWRHQEGGPGVAGVEIYRRYALYPGTVVATTGTDGFYQSDFSYIPGDEMVTVWAELDGYSFEPALYYWRHYHSYEVRTLDFVAGAPYTCYLPLMYRGIWSGIGSKEESYAHRR